MKEIEKLAFDKIKEKLDNLADCDRGAYMHGWFDCLHFMSAVLEKNHSG
jgi:hypothetical protein